MRSYFQKLFRAFTLMLIAAALPLSAHATGVKVKVDKDGKAYVVKQPGPFRETLTCGNLKASITIFEMYEKKPDIMALVMTLDGSTAHPVRLMSEFDYYLEDHHTLKNVVVGCLTGGGGIGLIFESSDTIQDAAYIQIDTNARIHSNFNQTGYSLKPVSQ